MTFCPHCESAEDIFDAANADDDLARYKQHGPDPMTVRLLDTLKKAGVAGLTLLDIGGGVGAIQHELIAAGVTRTTDVDASTAYLNTARREAEARGYAASASYIRGDFVALAATIDSADIVTMDRVICCYPDVNALVGAAASKARRFLAVVYPRDRWFLKVGMPLLNAWWRLRGHSFQNYIHPTAAVERLAAAHDLRKIAQHDSFLWQMAVYAR